MKRDDIKLCDVFISWTGTDEALKTTVAQALEEKGILPLLSDEHCQGDFEEWSREAATSSHIFMPIITEAALASVGMAWEIEAYDQKLASHEGDYFREAFLPIAESLSAYDRYRSLFSQESQNKLDKISAILLAYDNSGNISSKTLAEIADKTAERLSSSFFGLYCQKSYTDHIKLIPLYAPNVKDSNYRFDDLYISRTVTLFDQSKENESDSTAITPRALLNSQTISLIVGSAGSGKTQYINELKRAHNAETLVLSLPCVKVAQSRDSLFDLLFDEFHRICGEKLFYTKNNFRRLLDTKKLAIVFDGMDEITTQEATRRFIEKIESFDVAKNSDTALIFTGRNERDADLITIGNREVTKYRLEHLSGDDVAVLSRNLFSLFGSPEKSESFLENVRVLNQDIRQNALLLSQLAIVYEATGTIPNTEIGILDAVNEITLRTDYARHTLQIPEDYRTMVERDVSDILKRYSREKYIKDSEGRALDFTKILSHVLKTKYKEDKDAVKLRLDFLSDYLKKRAIMIDGTFHHKTFLEYFTALSFADAAFDEDYGEIEDADEITTLFQHYNDPYWADVIRFFLIKADAVLEEDGITELYDSLLKDGMISDYTLLFDACCESTRYRQSAEITILRDILARSVDGRFPAYGPLFWYVPSYQLYESTLLAAATLPTDARVLALVRDVCVITGGYYKASAVSRANNGSALFQKAEAQFFGVRRALCELFYLEKTDATIENDIYPRCFNPAEAVSFMENGHGIFGRMTAPFTDELGLFSHEQLPEVDGEYMGFVSAVYDKDMIEKTLNAKKHDRITALALTPCEAMRVSTMNDHISKLVVGLCIGVSMDTPWDNYRNQISQYFLTGNLSVFEAINSFQNDKAISRLEDARKEYLIKPSTSKLGYIHFIRSSIVSFFIPEDIDEFSEDYALFMPLNNSISIYRNGIIYGLSTATVLKISDDMIDHLPRFVRKNTVVKTVILPDRLNVISEELFADCTSLCEISLPASLKKIEEYAFSGCLSLREIDIPNSVNTIKASAFSYCTSLTKVRLPETLYSIEARLFQNCSALSHIHLPGKIRSIERAAFKKCTSLVDVTIPDSIQVIYEEVFQGCTSLKQLNLPLGVTRIETNAFSNCENLCTVSLPHSLQIIGDGAFYKCTALSTLDLPESVNHIGQFAFAHCTNLSHLTLPPSPETIHYETFAGCTALKTIILPQKLKKIGRYAFSDCTNLQELYLPESLSEIETTAFHNCPQIEKVYLSSQQMKFVNRFPAQTKFLDAATGQPMEHDGNCESVILTEETTIIQPNCFINRTSLKHIGLPFTLTQIGENAFKGCIGLSHIDFPPSLTEIGRCAFENCSALTKVVLPNTLRSLEAGAFHLCTNLREVHLPCSLPKLNSGVFSECTGLTNIVLPDSLTTIGYQAFYSCTSLTQINIPFGVTTLEESAFLYCTKLKSIFLPDSLTTVEESVFEDCSSLFEARLSESLTIISDSMFRDCISLKQIELPPSITRIGKSAFSGCIQIETISCPDSLTEIYPFAFKNCTALSSIQLPPQLEAIRTSVFMNCTSLSQIDFPDTLVYIRECAFENCSSLKQIKIPDRVILIGDAAFRGCVGVTKVDLSASLGWLRDSAFENCTSLAEIIFPDSLAEIGSCAFENCSALTELVIPANVRKIGDNAFKGCTALGSVTLSANFKNDIGRIFGETMPSLIRFREDKS